MEEEDDVDDDEDDFTGSGGKAECDADVCVNAGADCRLAPRRSASDADEEADAAVVSTREATS